MEVVSVAAPTNGEVLEVALTMVQEDGDPHLQNLEVVDGVATQPQVPLLVQELLNGDKKMTTIVQPWLAGLTMVALVFGEENLLQECQVPDSEELEEDQVDHPEVSYFHYLSCKSMFVKLPY